MITSLRLVEILVAACLIGVILLQVSGQGSGLFGAAESTGRVRRGLDKLLFQFTIVLTVLFLVIALLSARFAGRLS